jgi:hypothetical protein
MNATEAPKYQEAFILATNGEYPPMLRFTMATGDVRATSYAYLINVDYDKSGTITLKFSSRTVEIKGRRLDKLFGALVNHQVISVRQHSIADVRPPAGECCVDAVTITEEEA